MTLSLLLPPLLAGLFASFIIEQGLTPKPCAVWRRSRASNALHSGLFGLCFALVLVLVLRPWFAAVIVLAFQLLLVLVNQAKFVSLREAFIFQDFEYFTDAIKHPRLYLPFFGLTRTLAATIGFVGALAIGLWLETPLTDHLGVAHFVLLAVVLAAASLGSIYVGDKCRPSVTYQPSEDLQKLGQLAFFYTYWRAEQQTRQLDTGDSVFAAAVPESALKPHIVAVQSESFFDPRGLSDNIKAEVLAHFDAARNESTHCGRLQVPAWGANTVRTECGFLTGLTPEQLGIHQFNPYRLLAHYSVPNLVSYLKAAGYQTVCIHPYPASFYRRERVFPRMGFDQFIDISGFDGQAKNGQFIGDLSVADKVHALLESTNGKPLFVFVITMENHGPLHLEQPDPAGQARFYHAPPPADCNDLTVYLQHLQNADLMINRLKDSLLGQAQQRAGVLCWYGDHVPIMTGVYQRFGEPDGLSDYFIWQTAPQPAAAPVTPSIIPAHQLAALVLDSAGLADSRTARKTPKTTTV